MLLRARSRAADNAGRSIAARMAIMAITTNSSIRVKRLLFIKQTPYGNLYFCKDNRSTLKIIQKKKKIKGIKVVFMFYLCYFMLILCDVKQYLCDKRGLNA